MYAYQPDRLNKSKSTPAWIPAIATEHPGLFAGAGVSLLVMGAIMLNAIWFQPGKHPSPLFSTRAPATVETASTNETVKSKPAAKPAKVKTVIVDKASVDLLREIQTALSVRGYYSGKLDGVYGSRTNKAISDFQRDQQVAVNGKPSVRLLTQVLMSASSRPQEVPVPKPAQIANAPVKVKTVKVSQTVTNRAERPDGLVAQIQSGLKAYGYEDLQVDGKMGQHTATAIQRFQLDYGLKITGEPSDQVLKKLKEIGAYSQG